MRLDERSRLPRAHVLPDAQRLRSSIGANDVLELVEDDRLRVERQRRVAALVDSQEERIQIEVQDAAPSQREGVRHRSARSVRLYESVSTRSLRVRLYEVLAVADPAPLPAAMCPRAAETRKIGVALSEAKIISASGGATAKRCCDPCASFSAR